jgi:hypothetical protein
VATKKSKGKTTKRPVHVVSSGKARNRPSEGLRQSPTKPTPEETTAPKRSSHKPKPKSKPTEKPASLTHVARRKAELAERTKAKSKTYAGGLTAKAVNADKSLEPDEKKRIIAIINKNKVKSGEA